MDSLALSPYATDVLVDLRPLLVGFAGLFGLIVGSFLNVVIYRVPAGLSVVTPRSACPTCKTPIRALDNIPVLSWLVLGAKCRTCAHPISARYPAVEATTAVLFAVLTWWGLDHAPVMVPLLLYVGAIGVALFMIDLDTFRLPDRIVKPAYLIAVTFLVLAGWWSGLWHVSALTMVGLVVLGVGLLAVDRFAERLPEAVEDNAYPFVAGLLGVAAMVSGVDALVSIGGAVAVWLVVFWLPWALTRGRGMGLGDVKLAPVLGAVLGAFGWGPALVGLMGAFVFGAVIGVVLMQRGSATRTSKVPFGPYMLVGALVGLLVGDWLFGLYLNLTGIA